ncbi:MAG: antibiotic biosynthesis monooxygenase family protein [Chthoniobacterales bacterium]
MSASVAVIMKGVCVIVAYRPKPGKEDELLTLVRSRVPTLRKENLVTDRRPTLMRSQNGTIIEVSEWKSRAAIEAAHKNPNVLALWNKFFALCDCIPLRELAEANEMFAGFEPLDE